MEEHAYLQLELKAYYNEHERHEHQQKRVTLRLIILYINILTPFFSSIIVLSHNVRLSPYFPRSPRSPTLDS